MIKEKCLLCKKPAEFREFSPDGPADFFCSEKHWKINRDYLHAKGIAWRSGPLEMLDNSDTDIV
jgi:hypothetical protein